MEFSILGPLEVMKGPHRVTVAAGRERTLLALLLLAANRVVSCERLADDLWSGQPPPGAAQTMRVYVSRLRRALRTAGEESLILTEAPGYRLRLEDDALDAVRFERLIRNGRAQANLGHWDQAAATLGGALALWRGPALADITNTSLISVEAARLEEMRFAALEDRIEADLACGRHDELIAELEALITTNALRERLWGQRMIALYRSGRQGEALRAYQALRCLLREELGIAPSAAVQRLESAILRHDPDLDWCRPARGTGNSEQSRPWKARQHPGGVDVSAPWPPIPLPELLTGTDRVFVGRRSEIGRLRELWAVAAAGDRRVVLLGGEPGVGKTRLVAELARVVHAEGAAVLVGRCDEDLVVPYQPVVEALRSFVDHGCDAFLRTHLGRHGGELVRLVPELSEKVPGLSAPLCADPETARYRLFDAVAAWLATASSSRPILLVLDDLHWAAKATLGLLRHLIRFPESGHLMVIATYRDTELGAGHPLTALLADVRRGRGVTRMTLEGLTEADVAEFVRGTSACRSATETELSRAIHAATAGNPFFVEEVVRLLTETEAPRADGEPGSAARWLRELGAPQGVREVVARRLGKLSEDTNTIMRLAAVAGTEAGLEVLQGGLDEERLANALEEAVAGGLLVEVPATQSYRFTHALVRATLYDELSAVRRRRLHRLVGEALERLGEDTPERLTEMSHHFTAAAGGRPDALALRHTLAAAAAASAALASEQAAFLYDRALTLIGPDVTDAVRLELLLAAGDSHRRAGDSLRARELFLLALPLAEHLDDPAPLARATLGLGEISPVWAIDDELVRRLRIALERLGDDEPDMAARLLARLAQALYYSAGAAERSELSRRAVETAHRSGDPTTLASVLSARHAALWGPDDLEERLATANEVLALAEERNDRELAVQGYAWRVVDLLEAGAVDAMAEAMEAHATLAEELHQPVHLRDRAAWQCMRATLDGRFDDAERMIDTVFALSVPAQDPAATIPWCQRFWLAAERGRTADIPALTTDTEARHIAASQATAQWAWRAGFAVLHARQGVLQPARAALGDLGSEDLADIPRNAIWLNTLTFIAEAAAVLADDRWATALYDLVRPYAGRIAVMDRATVCKGSIDHYLGLLASTMRRWSDAEAHFSVALDVHHRLRSRPLTARTECAYASSLATRGGSRNESTAAKLAAHALTQAEDLGMTSLASQARAVLTLVGSCAHRAS